MEIYGFLTIMCAKLLSLCRKAAKNRKRGGMGCVLHSFAAQKDGLFGLKRCVKGKNIQQNNIEGEDYVKGMPEGNDRITNRG
jgi:hypothetical protein